MLATLGIEKDEDSDETFVAEDEEEEADLAAEEEEVETTHAGANSLRTNGTLEALFELSDEDEEENRKVTDVSDNSGYKPRKRTSKHLKEMVSMATERDTIENAVPPFPSGVIEYWERFDAMLNDYKRKYYLQFRVRSSETTDSYNR
ncbi:unnamed protein product [Phytophthora fragariaefolia]|uniref:Unnamed protein product n=1 Tax=Phytophthora fragariaefolia TaxID=1490495 RepID=A0A9W6YJD9_9STRA|nr:unnamed protein product [Phytophthora fragariaefolia]